MNDPFHRRPTLFTLDSTGNWNNYTMKQSGSVILNQDRTNNEANEIETLNGSSAYIGQDANGNITKAPQGPGAYGFVYDAWNRLVQLQYSSTPISTYVYDGQNRLLSSTGINRCFYYTSAWQIAEERELSAPTVTYAQYVWGQLGRDNVVLRNRPGVPDRYYALSDYASVRAIADTSGTLKERNSYRAYGAPHFMNPDWSPLGWSYVDWVVLYDSFYINAQTWYYHMRNRVLNTSLGRWLTRDPIGYDGGLNLYAYVGNNPVNRTDPLGLICDDLCPPGKRQNIRITGMALSYTLAISGKPVNVPLLESTLKSIDAVDKAETLGGVAGGAAGAGLEEGGTVITGAAKEAANSTLDAASTPPGAKTVPDSLPGQLVKNVDDALIMNGSADVHVYGSWQECLLENCCLGIGQRWNWQTQNGEYVDRAGSTPRPGKEMTGAQFNRIFAAALKYFATAKASDDTSQ